RAGFRAPRTRAAAGCGQWAVSAPAARPSTVSGATITALTVHSGSVQPIDSGAMTSGRPEASTGRACATASPAWARRPEPSHASSRGRSRTRPAPPAGPPPLQAPRREPSRPQAPGRSPPSGGRPPTIAPASAPSSALVRRAAARAPSSVSPARSGSDARAAASRAANAAFSAGPAGARRARRSRRGLPRASAATAAVTARTRRHATAPATDGRITTTYGNGCRRRRSPGCPFTGAGTPDPPRAARPARRAHASQRRGLALFLLVGVPLLPPRVGDVVVAALLPEAAAVLHHVLHAAHPLDALPRVQVRDHDAQGEAVVGG